jgi:hypothetical protein
VRVSQRSLRSPLFDCPWTGHTIDAQLVIRNSAVPNMIGSRCIKCGCMVYHLVEQSQILGADGELLPKA